MCVCLFACPSPQTHNNKPTPEGQMLLFAFNVHMGMSHSPTGEIFSPTSLQRTLKADLAEVGAAPGSDPPHDRPRRRRSTRGPVRRRWRRCLWRRAEARIRRRAAGHRRRLRDPNALRLFAARVLSAGGDLRMVTTGFRPSGVWFATIWGVWTWACQSGEDLAHWGGQLRPESSPRQTDNNDVELKTRRDRRRRRTRALVETGGQRRRATTAS